MPVIGKSWWLGCTGRAAVKASVLHWPRGLRHFREHSPFEKNSSVIKNGGTSSRLGGRHELSQTAAKTSVWSLTTDFASSQRR